MDNSDQLPSQSAPSKRKIWVTDAAIMKNVNKLAISTTNMDIYFFDMSTPVYAPQFHLCGEFIDHTMEGPADRGQCLSPLQSEL